MSLTPHEFFSLAGRLNRPDRVRVMEGVVILFYPEMSVWVRRSDWRVHKPFDTALADQLDRLGFGEVARRAVDKGEGIAPPRSYEYTALDAARAEIEQRMQLV